MKRDILRKELVFLIIIVLLSTSIGPSILANTKKVDQQMDAEPKLKSETINTATVSFSVFGKTGQEKHDIVLSSADAKELYMMFEELKTKMASNPYSETTQQLQQDFINLLEEKSVITTDTQKEELTCLLQPPTPHVLPLLRPTAPFGSKASEFMCTFISGGSGNVLPIIILPRFIPILLTPIPRAFIRWNVKEGFTSCGGLRSGTGFIAYGEQKGFALGFWGIGFTFSLPPIMNTYGIIGYALYSTVSADQIDHYPPNTPPEITQTSPADGQQMVPLTTTELRFEIEDYDNDLMSYNVTTEPDIGSGSAGLKPDGVYTIPISGLEDLTQYTWHIQVTDGKDTTEKTCSFITEPVAPILTNPVPANGEKDVPMDITHLRFTLKDYQGDPMDYTVETAPSIGGALGNGVSDGTYTVPISGLTYGVSYRWFVNVTDGAHWTRKVFSFETGYPSQFNPFEFGWEYRKQIIINHTQVFADLQGFPVFIRTIDADLIKAQEDGGDLLFMDGNGSAYRQYHELESFDHASGALSTWVNVSALSSTQDTVLYLYYGNPSCINQEYTERAWNPHYEAVWHLNKNPTGTIVDSTSHTNDGTSHGGMNTANLIDGKTGKCLSFDGVDDYISVPDDSSLKPVDVTLIAWFQPQEDNPPEGHFLAKHCYDYWDNAAGQTYAFYLHTLQSMRGTFERDSNEQVHCIGSYPIITNTWYHLTLTFEESTGIGSFYVNGVLEGTQICDSSVLWYNNPWDFTMGGCRWGTGGSQTVNTFFDCALDEVRVLNTSLDSGWITTEYNNQNNPSTFLSFGAEEPSP